VSHPLSPNSSPTPQTPLPVIANVSRIVTKVVDRITGDRSDYPLMVAAAAVEALKNHGIESRIMYGRAAWVEVLENHAIQWAGCWGESITFWVSTPSGEVVDLNASVAYKKRAHHSPDLKPIHSPPILWSREVPKFYRYVPEGVAELELFEEKDIKRFETILEEVREKCQPEKLLGDDEEFPNEPILCPGRKLLDDSHGTFKLFDRTLAVTGIPEIPMELLQPSAESQ
jgi:hypothetical protein